MQDNRLDFITNIAPEYIDRMTEIRKEFIALDVLLYNMQQDVNYNNDGVARCLSIARTNIETACQYAIKSLCLMGEVYQQ